MRQGVFNMTHPTLLASGECKLAARDNETGETGLVLFADTQGHKVAELVLHALGGRLVLSAEPKALLARLHEGERVWQPFLQIGRGDPRLSVPECLRHEGLRRIRSAEIRLPQIADLAAVAMVNVELARELRRCLLHTHAIPPRTDINLHTMVVMRADKFDLSRAFAPRNALMASGRLGERSRGKAHARSAVSCENYAALDGALRPLP